MQKDIEMFRRLIEIPNKAYELPHKDPCQHCKAIRFANEPPAFCCASGKIKMQLPKMPDELWNLYVNDMTTLGVEFRRRCRTYNNSLAFTSIKMTYDEALAKANKGVYTFKVQGIVRHYIHELTPKDGVPRHLQLYFYGTERELDNRVSQSEGLDRVIVSLLVNILTNNPYHNFFTNLQNKDDLDSYAIVLRANPKLDQRVYNLPVVDHVAAVWNEGVGTSMEQPRDIRVNLRSGGVRYVHYYYGCYDPLQYCLIFPYGEPGWYAGIPKTIDNVDLNLDQTEQNTEDHENNIVDPHRHEEADTLLVAEQNNLLRNFKTPSCVAMREYYCYLFQIRTDDITNILRTGRVIQQFQIDTYVKIETQRLDFFRHNQSKFEMRAESYQGIVESITSNGVISAKSVGKRVLLPKTFTGGPRDLRCRYMNALALVAKFGRPDIFLTMTCNPKWVEIQSELFPVEKSHNRADLYARVFRAKNEELKKEIVKDSLFGVVAAYFYVIEFQKRGLPHVHWLIILQPRYKVTSTEAYDRFVSAEIPDLDLTPHLHSCVINHMMHGPCGELNPKNACMIGEKCKSYYPKEFKLNTEHRLDSYPDYRRRDDGKKVLVRGKWLDNRWVVPYNAYLLAKFDCHINVQVCTDVRSVKYLYKYVCKGNDQIAYNIVDVESTEPIDEISDFQKSRWLCAPEAMWRIYGFDIFDMYPSVLQLHVHLSGYQQVFFAANQSLPKIVDSDRANRTQLTEFFEMNKFVEVAALNLLYREFVEHFVWSLQTRRWTPRSRLGTIGRLVSVNITEVERFYLRLLLNHVRAPTSFEDLKTSNGVLFLSFREAALDRGLLDSDNDVRHAIHEAATYQMPSALRKLFAIILVFNSPSDPKNLWIEFRDALSADIMRDYLLDHVEGYRLSLRSIDSFLQMMGHGIDEYSVVDYIVGLTREEINSREFAAEINMPVAESDLASVGHFNERQRFAYLEIMSSLASPIGSGFFIDGPGGTGKTFLYKAILATVRSTGDIALAVASSGVAASLLPNGRTAHSRFKIPLNLDESMSCSISKNTAPAKLIIAAKLILWDEASMANRKAVEALNLLLQDLMENQLLFGGKTVVLGGDFRQTIPIVRRGSREEIVDACLVFSSIWLLIRKIHLTQNMRAMEDPVFTDLLLRVGEGIEPNVHDDYINLPDDMCLSYHGSDSPLDTLVNEIFPSFDAYSSGSSSLINTAILTPKNECMGEINESLIGKFPGNMVEYVSTDYANDPSQQQYYQDYMNAISVGSLPPHVLKLKVNCPVMLLRNLNPLEGLCNGTRLIVRDLGRHVIGAVIAVGTHSGEYVLIPRIPLELDDTHICPITFKRLQFPLRLCFAISINKSQGQTLDRVGVYLPHPVFSHGQLYVALSRVRTSSSIKFLIRPPVADMDSTCETRNVVYTEILQAAT
ncbi:uncharacterized protein LOC130998777 [Salvia miltiorrhiza]|uniref:uncharacterized protein LOC130997033 n=1 Tax=Salvia miltiorrhiza TaxID=226208 RepID=UPI0025ACAB2A|nr:uncharacterized protein LOC130997033 [Salvia miltiorrhiza]XP_057780166.1 uncharacterized protein LOC130998777 [Salvia miltiorrhiza]